MVFADATSCNCQQCPQRGCSLRTSKEQSCLIVGYCQSPHCPEMRQISDHNSVFARMHTVLPNHSRDIVCPNQSAKNKEECILLTSVSFSSSSFSSSSSVALVVPVRMMRFSTAFSDPASVDRSLTKRLEPDCNVSDSCSNSRSCDAIFVPVTINAAGIFSKLPAKC